MKYLNLLVILALTSCFFFSKKERAKTDIERYYFETNHHAGSGQTKINSIEILSVNGTQIRAYIEGYYSNNSLAIPESREIKDTLIFEYYGNDKQRNLKIVSMKK